MLHLWTPLANIIRLISYLQNYLVKRCLQAARWLEVSSKLVERDQNTRARCFFFSSFIPSTWRRIKAHTAPWCCGGATAPSYPSSSGDLSYGVLGSVYSLYSTTASNSLMSKSLNLISTVSNSPWNQSQDLPWPFLHCKVIILSSYYYYCYYYLLIFHIFKLL